jgi:hypothetical protein
MLLPFQSRDHCISLFFFKLVQAYTIAVGKPHILMSAFENEDIAKELYLLWKSKAIDLEVVQEDSAIAFEKKIRENTALIVLCYANPWTGRASCVVELVTIANAFGVPVFCDIDLAWRKGDRPIPVDKFQAYTMINALGIHEKLTNGYKLQFDTSQIMKPPTQYRLSSKMKKKYAKVIGSPKDNVLLDRVVLSSTQIPKKLPSGALLETHDHITTMILS